MNQLEKDGLDYFGMMHALRMADKAAVFDEVPIGAVLLDHDGKVVAKAYNKVECKQSQLMHAEMQVIAQAAKKFQRWRLSDLTLYVTLEPCLMCMGALILSRVYRIVYAAKSPLFGSALDKESWFGIYKDSLPRIELQENRQAVQLLKDFFRKQRRMKNDSTRSFR